MGNGGNRARALANKAASRYQGATPGQRQTYAEMQAARTAARQTHTAQQTPEERAAASAHRRALADLRAQRVRVEGQLETVRTQLAAAPLRGALLRTEAERTAYDAHLATLRTERARLLGERERLASEFARRSRGRGGRAGTATNNQEA